jgi:hypothetical protein
MGYNLVIGLAVFLLLKTVTSNPSYVPKCCFVKNIGFPLSKKIVELSILIISTIIQIPVVNSL